MEIVQNFLKSLQYLSSCDTNLDQHFEIILKAQQQLPLQDQQNKVILDVLTMLLHKLTHNQDFNEFYIQQCIKVLQNIPLQCYQKYQQNGISIISSVIQILQRSTHQLILLSLQILNQITDINELLSPAIPQLTSQIIQILLNYNKSLIHQEGLKILNKVISNILKYSNFQKKQFNISTLKMNEGDLLSTKINEYLQHFCKLNQIQLTPKISLLYQNFVLEVLKQNRIFDLLEIKTQIDLIYLYFKFSDQYQELNKLIIKQEELQITIAQVYQSELRQLKYLNNQIDSIKIIQQIRFVKYFISILYKQNSDSFNIQILYKSLKSSIYYEKKDLPNNQLEKYKFEQLNLEYIKIVNNDKSVYKELIEFIQILKFETLNTLFYNKIQSLIKTINDQIIVMENRIIHLKIHDILQLASLLFIFNNLPSINIQESEFRILISQCYTIFIDHKENYNIILQYQLSQMISRFYESIQKNAFLDISYLDYQLCLNASEIQIFQTLSQEQISQLSKNNDYIYYIKQNSGSIIYRNIHKLRETNLYINKGHSIKTLLHLVNLDAVNEDFIYPILESSFQLFDKYYLKSEHQFIDMYLKFLNNILKKWRPTILDNSVITILRQIILQVAQFITNKNHQLIALQCFYHVIPKLSKAELQDSKPQDIFGMNDDSHVKVPNTLGVVFFEQRKAFEIALTEGDWRVLNQVWKIITQIYEYNQELGFFQFKNVEYFLKLTSQNEFVTQEKVAKSISSFCQQYIKQLKNQDQLQFISTFLLL